MIAAAARDGQGGVEAELVLGGLESVFDRPAMAFDGDEVCKCNADPADV